MSRVIEKMHSDEFEFIHCHLCGANEFRTVLLLRDRFCGFEGEFKMVKCVCCGLFYLNPRPTRAHMGKFYSDNYYSYEASADIPVKVDFLGIKGWFRQQIIKKNNFLGKCLWYYFVKMKANWRWFYAASGLGRDCRILEIGSGAGNTLRFFQKFGWKVMGVEVSEKAVAEGKKNGIQIFLGDLCAQEIPPRSTDLIWMSHTFEHMHDPNAILRAAHNILKSDGRVVMEIPVADGLQPWIFSVFCPVWDAPRHLFIYTQKTLKRMGMQNGFEMKVLGRYFSKATALLSLRMLGRENKTVQWILGHAFMTKVLNAFVSLFCVIGQLFNLGETLVVELRLANQGQEKAR